MTFDNDNNYFIIIVDEQLKERNMALINLNIHSNEIAVSTPVTIVYPDLLLNEKDFNVLFLLHGYTGNNTDWVRYTSIEKLAIEHKVMVVMPSINNSYYTNMEHGYNYFNYYTEELPNIISKMFKVTLRKENTYITGLSMGGYGALKAALSKPDQYNGVAAFSGVLDITKAYVSDERKDRMFPIFGNKETYNKNKHIHDLFLLSNNLKNKDLNIYISCGTEDFLYQHNIDFHKHLKQNNIKHTYNELPGDHNWDFWGSEIKKALNFFFGAKK